MVAQIGGGYEAGMEMGRTAPKPPKKTPAKKPAPKAPAPTATTSTTSTTTEAPVDPVTGYPYGSSGDIQVLAEQNNVNASNAITDIGTTLTSLGLGAMANWATNLAGTLAGRGIASGTIVSTIISQLNTPTDANGQTDQDALNAFNTAMPGYNELIQRTGQNGSPGSSPEGAIANYISYVAQVSAFAQTAGLLPGTITPQAIGELWAGQNSTDEVSTRITLASQDADQSMPQPVKDYLAGMGLTGAGLTSYYLNPTNTINQIQTMQNTGITGGIAAATGFDSHLSVANSQAIASFLSGLPHPATGGSNGTAFGQSVAPVTVQQAENFYGSSIGQGPQGTLPTVAQAGAYQGESGPTVSEGDVLGAAGVGGTSHLTQEQALQEVGNVQAARTAGAKGGGGAVTTQKGALGVGFAQ